MDKEISSLYDLPRISKYTQIMSDVSFNIQAEIIKTKRDVYYGATELFRVQSVLDKIVAELAIEFKVPRDALNLIAAGKGLVFGELTINGRKIDSVQLIPAKEEIYNLETEARFILVIEKDAIMTSIVQHYNQLSAILGPFVVITGKGYPCLKTKQLLHLLETTFTTLPIYCLVDHDPYGIHISLTYVKNSKNENDGCKSLRFLGITRSDLDSMASNSKMTTVTEADDKKISTLREMATEMNRIEELNQLIIMQNTREKAEIESIYDGGAKTFCLQYLPLLNSQDAILKNRLQVDERIIKKIAKKLLDGRTLDMSSEIQSFDLSMDKIAHIIDSFGRNWNEIINLGKEIESSMTQERLQVEEARNGLATAQQYLQNITEYDSIASEILALRSRDDLKQNIVEVESQIASIMAQIDTIDTRIESRLGDCRSVLSSLHSVYDTVSLDIQELKK